MNRLPTTLEGLALFELRRFEDDRGVFMELFRQSRYAEAGLNDAFVQDNVSVSHTGVLRGLHIQAPNPQGKLISVLHGSVWDVAVDLRPNSSTFGAFEAYELSAANGRQFFIPKGFAHGFVVLEGPAVVAYKVSGAYDPSCEMTLRFDDPDIAIPWPVTEAPILSPKDRDGLFFRDLPLERLSQYDA